MDKATKERLNILAGVSTIEFFVRSKAIEMVDSVSKIHPMMKLYFDSELNSDIENNALIAMSEALIWSVEAFTEKGPMSNFRSIGVGIAQTLSKRMYFAKLIHHANIGRITAEQFYEYAAEYIAAESVNVINQLWDVLGAEIPQYLSAGIQKTLEFFEVDSQTAEWVAGLIDSAANVAYSYVKKFLTQDNIKKFVYNVLKFTIESARSLAEFIDKSVKTAKDLLHKTESKIKSWGISICKYFNWDVPDFLKEESLKEVDLDDLKFCHEDNSSPKMFVTEIEEETEDEEVEEDTECEIEDVEEGQIKRKPSPKKKKDRTKSK